MNKSTEIIFVTEYEGFANIKELRPYPASEYMPEWFRKLPLTKDFLKKVT